MEELYLITGAAGHLGRVVTQKLIKNGKEVRALVLPGEKHIPKHAKIYYGDVRDEESLESFFENSEEYNLVVIHCAGIVSIASKIDKDLYDVNVVGTNNIINLCKKHKVSKMIYVSSVHAIPEKEKGQTIKEIKDFNPDNVIGAYAKTKSEATANVLQAGKDGLNVCVVHPSGIAGPYDYGRGHITTLVRDYYKKRLTSGIKGAYDFVDVRDVADGILSVCEKGDDGECYILSNKCFQVKEILDMLHDITGKGKIRSYLPLWFAKGTAPLAELYYKILRQPPLYTTYSIYTLNTNADFSHEKATKTFGYKTRDMKETLMDTVYWLKKIGKI